MLTKKTSQYPFMTTIQQLHKIKQIILKIHQDAHLANKGNSIWWNKDIRKTKVLMPYKLLLLFRNDNQVLVLLKASVIQMLVRLFNSDKSVIRNQDLKVAHTWKSWIVRVSRYLVWLNPISRIIITVIINDLI